MPRKTGHPLIKSVTSTDHATTEIKQQSATPNRMIEPIMTLPSFSLTGPVRFNVNSVEAPFIIHWLEWQAQRTVDGSERPASDWSRAENLLTAALNVASIWNTSDEIKDRLVRKLDHAAAKRAGRP